MKRKWIGTGQDLLIILNNHLVLIAFAVMIMGMFRQDDHKLWLWSLLLSIPLIFYWARIKISNFFLFFALHLAIPAGFFFLPIHIVPKALMLFISSIYFIWSVKIRTRAEGCGEGVASPLFVIGALGIMMFIETTYLQSGWAKIYIAMAIIYLAGYFIHIFIRQYMRFLLVNESTAANIPEAEIFNKGFGQSFLFAAGVATFLVLTVNVEFLSYIVSWIGSILYMLLKFLLSGLSSTEEEVPQTPPVEFVPPDMGMFAEPTGKPSFFWIFLEKLFVIGGIIFIVGLVVLIIYAIVKGVWHLWNEFHKNPEIDEKQIDNGIDIREVCTIEKRKKEGSNLFAFLNNREKIRKIYRKQVLKNKIAIIKDSETQDLVYMTAKECCDRFEAEQLKKMYEKARYSADEIGADDVRTAKSGGR